MKQKYNSLCRGKEGLMKNKIKQRDERDGAHRLDRTIKENLSN
jgi:hypothetical protein